jgi:ubiquinone/menaquinone biosynthesis C-methylase UbiE
MYQYMFPERRFVEASTRADKIVKLTNPRGNAVLDLCCGPGRYAIALAQRGFNVTGVDRTSFLLKKARARAKTEQAKIEWVQQDMRSFVRPNAYDLVVSMLTSFGYFDNKQEDLGVLGNIFSNLKSGTAGPS